jgi:hypothetical protein
MHHAGSHRFLCMGLFSIFLLSGPESLGPDLIHHGIVIPGRE